MPTVPLMFAELTPIVTQFWSWVVGLNVSAASDCWPTGNVGSSLAMVKLAGAVLRAGRAGRGAVIAEAARARPRSGAGQGDRLRQLDSRRDVARRRRPGDVRLAAAPGAGEAVGEARRGIGERRAEIRHSLQLTLAAAGRSPGERGSRAGHPQRGGAEGHAERDTRTTNLHAPSCPLFGPTLADELGRARRRARLLRVPPGAGRRVASP